MTGSTRKLSGVVAAVGCGLILGCMSIPGTTTGREEPSAPRESAGTDAVAATPAQAERLRRLMVPLLAKMDRPLSADQVSVGILGSSEINAANAGGGRFFVTAGLLARANDDRLRAVLAHEIAHEDLKHVANAQVLQAGLGIGVAILEHVFPGSGTVTPYAGELVARKYSRDEEFAADRQAVVLLKRAGYRKESMIDALTWLMQESGPGGGGFFATHPGTVDRIAALRAG
jgi:predicted Zn-dependent protease